MIDFDFLREALWDMKEKDLSLTLKADPKGYEIYLSGPRADEIDGEHKEKNGVIWVKLKKPEESPRENRTAGNKEIRDIFSRILEEKEDFGSIRG